MQADRVQRNAIAEIRDQADLETIRSSGIYGVDRGSALLVSSSYKEVPTQSRVILEEVTFQIVFRVNGIGRVDEQIDTR